MERRNGIRALLHVPEENPNVRPMEGSLDVRQQPRDMNS